MVHTYLTISLHDVTPRFKIELKEIFLALEKRSVASLNLLVVPNYHNEFPISSDQDFINLLKEPSMKKEFLQHGFSHISTNKSYNSIKDKIKGELLTGGCAEFQNINYQGALVKIKKGAEILRKSNLICEGFVPPGWLANQESKKAIKDTSFNYHVGFNFIEDLKRNKTVSHTILGFTPTPLVDHILRAYCFFSAYFNSNAELIEIAIHPQDLHGSNPFKSTLKLLDILKKDREIVTYSEFLTKINNKKN